MSDITQGKIHDAAMIAHEANRAYCLTIGDSSHVDWRSTPENIRASVISGAQAIADDPSITPEQSHEKWSAYKTAEGWVYGPVKDLAAKTHPCLVPYAELAPEQRAKDALFGAVVRVVLGLPLPSALSDSSVISTLDHDAIVETLSDENAGLRAEVDKLRATLASPQALAAELLCPMPASEPTEAEGAEA